MTPSPLALNVLYHDEKLLVVDKPSGMLVHRGWGRDDVTLADLVRDFLGGGVVHPLGRLDRGASGIVVFGLSREIAQTFSNQSADSPPAASIEKRYVALVRGKPPEFGTIDYPLPNKPGGDRVPAVTQFKRLASVKAQPREVSLVEARPITGRLHQIRKHLRHIDHPLIGDTNYTKAALNHAFEDNYGLSRLALHAYKASIHFDSDTEEIIVRAILPDDFLKPLLAMGFKRETIALT